MLCDKDGVWKEIWFYLARSADHKRVYLVGMNHGGPAVKEGMPPGGDGRRVSKDQSMFWRIHSLALVMLDQDYMNDTVLIHPDPDGGVDWVVMRTPDARRMSQADWECWGGLVRNTAWEAEAYGMTDSVVWM